MDTKKAYLDALNAGRRRRPTTSIEDLNRTLADLEDAIAGRTQGEHPWDQASNERTRYDDLARSLDRMQEEEKAVAEGTSIAGELFALREELNTSFTASLAREFDELRKELHQDGHAVPNRAIDTELERLAGMIEALASRGDEASAARLRSELGDIRQLLDNVAKEKTLAALQERMEAIGELVGALPDSAAMRSLDDKLKTLAAAMDRFASQTPLGESSIEVIDERLDEITRAIAASATHTRTAPQDAQAFERIEARIGSLAKQIDELMEDRGGHSVVEQIELLSTRIDELARRAALPDENVTRLSEQVAAISQRMQDAPAAPDLSSVFAAIEERFAAISAGFDERHEQTAGQSRKLFGELEARLEDLSARIDNQKPPSSENLLAEMDARFETLAARLDARTSDVPDMEVIHGFETRLDGISRRLEATTASLAAIDPDLVRSLEAQVANLSEAIASPAARAAGNDDVAPRLARLEETIAENHHAVLEAARRAAEDAVAAMDGRTGEGAVVKGLADDLRSLEALARRSDDRNTRTFEAIHDTLMKIVERLGTIESEETRAADTGRQDIAEAPSIEADADQLALGPLAGDDERMRAASDETPTPPAEGRRSMLGGFGRVLKNRRGQADTAGAGEGSAGATGEDAPEVDDELANRPLEPGSGGPDLNAIMRRVRDERAGTGQASDAGELGKSDFIAAARRAAQAAAAEAEMMKQAPKKEGAQRFKLGRLLKSHNKALTMGIVAIALALAGLKFGGQAIGIADAPESAQVAAVETSEGSEATIAEPDAISAATAQFAEAEVEIPDILDAEPLPVIAAKAAPDAAALPVQKTSIPTPAIAGEEETAESAESAAADTDAVSTAAIAEDGAEEAAPAPAAAETVSEPPAAPDAIANEALLDAVDEADPKAYFEIANRLAEGRGLDRDLAEAAIWYEAAAERGLAPAQYRLGNLLEKGNGVERDIEAAKIWYAAAAEKGNASAMHNLAVLHAMGADGITDNDEAARLFEKAAELGVTDSQYNMGILMAKGVGMEQDLPAAYKWFALVAKTGDADAGAKRDEIAELLDEKALERARQAVELWEPRKLDTAANAVEIPAAWSDEAVTTASIDVGQAIARVQTLLAEKGYDAGPADGILGERTKQAIAAFQEDHGMAPTGAIDEDLVRSLLDLG